MKLPATLVALLLVIATSGFGRARAADAADAPGGQVEEIRPPSPRLRISDESPPADEVPPGRESEPTYPLLPPVSSPREPAITVLERIERTLQNSSARRAQRLDELREELESLRTLTEIKPAPLPPVEEPASERPAPADEASHTSPLRSPVATMPAGPLAAAPVDRFALANTLFAAGQFSLALETYRQIHPESLAPDARRWARYQAACCLRRLGSVTEAEQLYRELVSESSDDVVGMQSRWWLDRTQKRQRAENRLKSLNETLKRMETQIHDGSTS